MSDPTEKEAEEVLAWARDLVADWRLPSGDELARLRRILRAPTGPIPTTPTKDSTP